MEVTKSICRNCSASCPILVTVDGGKVLRVEGDREAPLYKGFTCPKGRALPRQQAMPNRLMHSLKLLPDGRRIPISSEQLVEEVAQQIARIMDAHGPQSVAAFFGGGVLEQWAASSMMLSFLQAIKSPMLFSSATIDQPGQLVAQALHGVWQGGRIHPKQCEAFLVVGGNPVVSKQHFPQNPAQQLKSLTNAGMQLIVIDPRRTETTRRAAVHLQAIPGEDPTVLAGLIHLIFTMDGVNREFVELNAEGVDALRGVTLEFTPDYVAARAGVEVKDLIAAARVLVNACTGDAGLGVGSSFATRGTLSAYLVLCIQTLRGFWAREGDAVSRPHVLLPRSIAKAQPSPPWPAWGFGLQTSVRGLQQTAAGMPTAALPELMLAKDKDRIRALFLHAGAMYTWPQQARTIEALNAIDLLVMHDLELSATAAKAHYVIATKTQLEIPQMTLLGEAAGKAHPGYAWTEPYAMYQPAAVEPPPGSDLLESWQIYYRVAQKLGIPLELLDIFGATTAPPKIDMTREPNTDDLYELMCHNSAIPLSRVKQYPHGAIFDEARDVVRARDPACSATLQLADPAMMEELLGVRREDVVSRRKTNAEYPFLLISRRVQTTNCSAPRVPGLAKTPYNPAFMHPVDLQRLSLTDGSMVEINSRHGSIIGFVESDPDMRPGVVAMTAGFGAKHGMAYDPRRDGANVNQLISWEDDADPYHGMPRMGALPISIKAVEKKASAAAPALAD